MASDPNPRRTIPVRSAPSRGTIQIGDQRFASIGSALVAARPGDSIDLGPGEFGRGESWPLEVAADVTLRSAAASEGRTSTRAVLNGSGRPPGTPLVALRGPRSALENLELLGGPAVAVELEASGVRVTDCVLTGDVELHGSPEAVVSFNRINGSIAATETNRVTMTGNRIQPQPNRVAIEIDGGADHRIDGNDLDGGHGAIYLRATRDARVTGNRSRSDEVGILLDAADQTEVSGNHVRQTTHAIRVVRGSATRITANVADDCDTGLLLEHAAADTAVESNRWSGCRVAVRRAP